MSAKDRPETSRTVPQGVDRAVGVPEKNWFVAVVNHNSEKATGEKLEKIGIENYVAVQEELRIWKNGRRAKVYKVVIPSVVFVYCTELQRKEIVNLPYIFRFMTNKAGATSTSGNKPIAIIPDHEIRQLKFMVGNSDSPVTFKSTPYRKGDRVRVIRGKLAGLEGDIQVIDEKHSELTVNLSFLGSASLTIETINVEPIV